MADSVDNLLTRRWHQFADDVRALLRSEECAIGKTQPPQTAGVYLLLDEFGAIVYVGVAANLCDRFQKHVSGDESHAIQRALVERFPDRLERRSFIKGNVRTKWLLVNDAARLADLERLLIWLYQPAWNRR